MMLLMSDMERMVLAELITYQALTQKTNG